MRRLLLALVILAGIALTACGGGGPASGQPTVAGNAQDIHPCLQTNDPLGVRPAQLVTAQPTSQPTAAPTAAATTTPVSSSASAAEQPGCAGPDFSQRCVLWGNDEYDHANSQDVGCGKTMAQCGCALTAAASLLVRYGITRGPDGQPTNPKTLNEWMKADAKTTAAGTVSRGYVYGMVSWVAIAQYSQLAAAKFGTPALSYVGNLAADLGALQKEVAAKRPVILEQPGHFVLATAAEKNTVDIADPFYPDRKFLDVAAYKNRFISGRLYRAGNGGGAIMVVAPKGVQFTLTDAKGNTTGFRDPRTIVTDVKLSTLTREPMWRDPTCTTGPAFDDAGVSQIYVPDPASQRWTIQVQGQQDKPFSITMMAYDNAGNRTAVSVDGKGNDAWTMDYNATAGSLNRIQVKAQATPPPSPSATPRPGTATVTANRTVTPTATATATPTAGPTASITLTLNPSTVDCSKTTTFTTVLVSVKDATGKPAPPTNVVLTSVKQTGATDGQVGKFGSDTVTTAGGGATTRFSPTTALPQTSTGSPTTRVIEAHLASSPTSGLSARATLSCSPP